MLQGISDITNFDATRDKINAVIVDYIKKFKKTLHSKGVRPKGDQQTINTIDTAAEYLAEEKFLSNIINHIDIPHDAAKIMTSRLIDSGTDSKTHNHHFSCVIRKDKKRKLSLTSCGCQQ